MDFTDYTGPGGSLLKRIYASPDRLPSPERLALRSSHLHELAVKLEQAVQGDIDRELIRVYSWAIDSIAMEIRLVADRVDVQMKCGR